MGREKLPFGRVINPGVFNQNFAYNLPSRLTGTTNATDIPLGSSPYMRIPGGLMGPNGEMVIEALFSFTNSANIKQPFIFLGNADPGLVQVLAPSNTTTASFIARALIANRNNPAVNIQMGQNTAVMISSGTSTVRETTIDTDRDMLLKVRGQLANAGEFIQLERISVSTVYRD